MRPHGPRAESEWESEAHKKWVVCDIQTAGTGWNHFGNGRGTSKRAGGRWDPSREARKEGGSGQRVREPASSFLGTNIVGLYSTCASPVVPHLSTRHAHGCLASEIGRDPAFPTRFDRTENSCEVTSLVIASGHSAQEHMHREWE